MKIRQELVPYIKGMLYELQENKLTVEKVPQTGLYENNDGRELRVVTCVPPLWYRGMCSLYMKFKTVKGKIRKREQTIIERSNTIKLLKRMIKNKKTKSKYAPHILIEAKRRYLEFNIPWDNQF